jgi:hypothetical protein
MWVYVDSDPRPDRWSPRAYIACTHSEIIVSFGTRDWPAERTQEALKRAYMVAAEISTAREHSEDWAGGSHDGEFTYDEFWAFIADRRQAAATVAAKRVLTAKRRMEFSRVRHDVMLALIDSGVHYVCAKAECEVAQELHLDHIIPMSRGGTDDLNNMQFLCVSHNAAKGDQMPVYSLRPVADNLTHPDWARSKHREQCHVSARNEEEAREFAKNEFDIAASKPMPGSSISVNPWLNPDLVECTGVGQFGGESMPHGMVTIPSDHRD